MTRALLAPLRDVFGQKLIPGERLFVLHGQFRFSVAKKTNKLSASIRAGSRPRLYGAIRYCIANSIESHILALLQRRATYAEAATALSS